MKIIKQKPIKSQKKPRNAAANTREDVIRAIKKEFTDIPGRIDIRFLYSDGGSTTVHRVRVNWWQEFSTTSFGSEQRITHSEFIRVVENDEIKIEVPLL